MGYTYVSRQLNYFRRTPMLKTNYWEFRSLDLAPIFLLAQKINIPFRSLDTQYDKVKRINYYTNYNDPIEVNVTFLETEQLDVTRFFEDWKSSFLTSAGVFRKGIDPRRDFTATLQKTKNLARILTEVNVAQQTPFQDTRDYTFLGCRLKTHSELQLDYESGDDKYLIEATFSVDRIETSDYSPLGL